LTMMGWPKPALFAGFFKAEIFHLSSIKQVVAGV